MIFKAKTIFTGSELLPDHAIIVNNNIIENIVPSNLLEKYTPVDFEYNFIAPAFIDLQIYGAGGKLFSMYPETESLHNLEVYCRKGGAHHFLPTIATNTYEVFYKSIDAIKKYWDQGGKGVLGLHIEGPWINPLKRGAHIESLIHSPTPKQVKILLDYGKDVIKMITLAPEVCSLEVIDLITSYGIIISAGHSNATYNQGTEAFKNIPVATHLFNAMSPVQHRAPGLSGAILNNEKVMASIIPDGVHVNFEMVQIAKKIMGERLFIITDAVTETSGGPYPHTLHGDRYVANGILSGSALDMAKGVRNLITYCGLSLSEALKMASLYPAKVIGLEHKLGIIKKGGEANLVFLDENLKVIELQ